MPYAALNPIPSIPFISRFRVKTKDGLSIRMRSAKARSAQRHLQLAERLLKKRQKAKARVHLSKAKKLLVAFKPRTASGKKEKAELLKAYRNISRTISPTTTVRKTTSTTAVTKPTTITTTVSRPTVEGGGGFRFEIPPDIADRMNAAVSRPKAVKPTPSLPAMEFSPSTPTDFTPSDDEMLIMEEDEEDEAGIPMWLIGLGVAGAAFAAYKLLR
jgi:hypothetical protein